MTSTVDVCGLEDTHHLLQVQQELSDSDCLARLMLVPEQGSMLIPNPRHSHQKEMGTEDERCVLQPAHRLFAASC